MTTKTPTHCKHKTTFTTETCLECDAIRGIRHNTPIGTEYTKWYHTKKPTCNHTNETRTREACLECGDIRRIRNTPTATQFGPWQNWRFKI